METQTIGDADSPASLTRAERKHRSPAYPAIALGECLRLVKILFEKERKHLALSSVIAGHWGYSAKSSGALLAIAACKRFGLLNEEGSRDKRMLSVSDSAIALLNPANPNQTQMLKETALRPEIFAELWKKYNGHLPSTETITAFLVFERGFAEDAARSVLATFKETIAFAKLTAGDRIEETVPADERPEEWKYPDRRLDTEDLMQSPNQTPPPSQTTQQVAMREFPVPLLSGAIASFKVPHPMSEEDYALFKALIEAMKPGLVKKG